MAKTNSNSKPGRYTAKYWETKVYRPSYVDRHGEQQECSTYYARIKHAGVRKAVPLHTSDRSEAGRQAATFYARLRLEGWDAAIQQHDPQHGARKCAFTVGDVIATLNVANLRERTRGNYSSALRWFAARHIGFEANKKTFGPTGSAAYRERVEAVRLNEFTDEVVKRVLSRHETAAGNDPNAQLSARISAASFLRNAKAALRIVIESGLKVPDPKPFAGITGPKAIQPRKYVSTFDAGKLLREAKDKLADKPAIYAAFLLALGAGLRRNEILNLTWKNVDKDRNRVLVLTNSAWQTKNPTSEAAVDVDAGLLNALEPFRAGLDEHVTNPKALDELTAWLRQNGVGGFKPLHTLRKEAGSIVCEQADLLAASRYLRHSNIAVTAAVYVENRKCAAPRISAMLQPEPPPKNGKVTRKRMGKTVRK